MEFEINSMTYTITENTLEEIRDTYNKDMPEKKKSNGYFFGVTDFKHNKILLNEDICEEMKIKTLKHELTHIWIFNTANNYTSYTEEDICNIVSDSNKFIDDIVKKYINYKKI